MVQKQVRSSGVQPASTAQKVCGEGKTSHRVALNGHVCSSQVVTKTVAQCVEFYYTYKKHVKIGRNGTLLYGEAEPSESRSGEEEAEHKVAAFYGLKPRQLS